jgi:hypothetical protein
MKVPAYINVEMAVALADNCDAILDITGMAGDAGHSFSDTTVQGSIKRHVRKCEICRNAVEMESAFARF